MKSFRILIFFLTIIFFTNCDPGAKVELRIFNSTSRIIQVKYCEYYNNVGNYCDTLVMELQPNSDILFKSFSERAYPNTFNCCPCKLYFFSMSTSFGLLKKDPSNPDNWEISNKTKLKRRGGPTVKCVFHILPTDI